MKSDVSPPKEGKPTIEELCKKYDNLILIKDLKKTKVPLLGTVNCNK